MEEKKTKPTQRVVSTNEVIAGIYGNCPRCGDLCHLKRNPFRNRPQFRMEMQRIGERGNYIVDWHDHVVDGQVRRGQSCYGSNAIPARLVKEEQTNKEATQ